MSDLDNLGGGDCQVEPGVERVLEASNVGALVDDDLLVADSRQGQLCNDEYPYTEAELAAHAAIADLQEAMGGQAGDPDVGDDNGIDMNDIGILSSEDLAAIADLQEAMGGQARDPEEIVVETALGVEIAPRVEAALGVEIEPSAVPAKPKKKATVRKAAPVKKPAEAEGGQNKPTKKEKPSTKKKPAVRDGVMKLNHGPKKRTQLAQLVARALKAHDGIDPEDPEVGDYEFDSSLGLCSLVKQPGDNRKMQYIVTLDLRQEVLPEGGDISSVEWTWISGERIKFSCIATGGVGQRQSVPSNTDINRMSHIKSDTGIGEGFGLSDSQLERLLGPIHTNNVSDISVNKQLILLAANINLEKLVKEALNS